MGSGPVDPRELLKGLDCFLGKDGEVRSSEGVSKIFSLMKTSQKMVSRCIYLNILLQTKSQDILNRFIKIGGYKLLNSWLTYSKTTNNTPLLHLILLTLQNLPLKVDHLKQNNTAKVVKQLSKTGPEELRKQASVLVEGWMAIIRTQSGAAAAAASAPSDKKKKEEGKGKAAPEKTEMKPDLKGAEAKAEEDKRKEKPKVQRTTAPSHAKFRSTGLEVDTPTPVPVKKVPPPMQVGDKYNIKPAPVKRQNSGLGPDMQPVEKKYKPLNTTPNMIKEIKVKIIPAQPIESPGFLEALNSAPVTGVKIKKKKKAVSPTSNKSCPFDIKPNLESSPVKHLSLDSSPTASVETMELEQPGTPVPAEEVPENMDTAPEEPNALAEPRGEEKAAADTVKLTKKGKKKKNVRWAEENHLREYFFFELDETERVNVNKIKDFGEAAKREMMMDRQAFESARRHSHDAMEEKVPWSCPWPLDLPHTLVVPGSGSQEKVTQQEREKGILQEIFLSKESVPDSPHEPDPESYEPLPPKLIPLDEDSSTMEDGYSDPMDTTPASHSPDVSGAKLPTVLANLMGSMGASRSPQQPGSGVVPPVNVQELLSTIMGAQGNQKPEDLIKQPDFSDKIKKLLGSLQQQQQQQQPQQQQPQHQQQQQQHQQQIQHQHPPQGPPPGLLGMGPGMNGGFPPGPKNGPHFPPHGGPGGHFPPHNGPGGPPGGPRMMGPPPPQQRGGDGYWKPPGEPMRGGPHGMRGGPFHRGRGGRGENPSFRGRPGRGSSGPPRRGGPNNSHMGDMSNRDVCRHFMMKGSCRYENNCAFYHPGVNGPPLP
ncbi:serine/threonine-protein phosphatase 1 regulatory subunit 10-like [Huso huso]|uniref:Serine/threonine-protein phosphatase 1 regulatory subunit 10 n=1 Tax=Huso huso TaxID=61971 RepID=A0ABR0YBE6_HUSHU